MARRLRSILFITAAAAAFFAIGYFVGQDMYVGPKRDPRSWKESVYASYPNVQDAMRRWAAKDGISVDRAMATRSIEMMHFPDRDCVQLQLPIGSAGGVPIYCYRSNTATSGVISKPTTKLAFEHSDVQ
jgi:hypothetical protein